MNDGKRMGRVLRTASLVAAGGMAVAMLGACGSNGSTGADGSSSDGKYNIAYIGSKGTSFQTAIYSGIKSVDGVTASFIEVGFDVTKEVQAIQNAVASGRYQGLVIFPNSATGLVAAVNQAIKAGIQVFNVDSPIGSDPYSTKPQIKGQAGAVVADDAAVGKKAGELAVEACKAKNISPCNVARVGGLPQFAVETEFENGSKDALAAAGTDNHLLKTVYAGGYDSNSGYKAAQDVMAANPDVNVILSADPLMKGIQQAVKGKGIQLVSYAGTKYAYEQVANGTYYGEIAFFPVYEGEVAAKSIIAHIKDPKLPANNPPAAAPGLPFFSTKATLGDFRGQYE
ncbi:MAG: sugar ABC transporter substrate-binding protein [Nocardioides sp.]|uniref:sugar ABC transporter substrate-binding protein n=1 Tax=Nocardioides sp. TaxID=35761 RepID=UPI0039E601FE